MRISGNYCLRIPGNSRESTVLGITGGNSQEFLRFSKNVVFLDSDSSILRKTCLFQIMFKKGKERSVFI